NKLQLFTDQTGNRRFMLVNAKAFNFEHKIDLNQLWAEAYHYYQAGEKWFFTAKDTAVKSKQSYDNANALNVMDDMTLDLLNNTFDHTQPDKDWIPYTFPRIQAMLGLKLRSNSYEFKLVKRTVIHWLSLVTPTPRIIEPKAQGTAWYCFMPPLKKD
ncbi:MAG: virulence-associated E family protein, partial [Bacteroidetes bacterium]|nr:virulence-associated E family protein [Bacteroidota bacterium]